MEIAVIGAGLIGGILGRALARSGHAVVFGARRPDEREVVGDTAAIVTTIPGALAAAEVVVLAVPGAAVADLSADHGALLAGKLVIDATNQMGRPVANAQAELPDTARYARAFNTLGGENMEHPDFVDGPADLFFSAPDADRAVVEEVTRGVGLNPVDALFQVWIALAIGQGRGRRPALRLIDH
jgi:predicted dinucleotide-binding enzyme